MIPFLDFWHTSPHIDLENREFIVNNNDPPIQFTQKQNSSETYFYEFESEPELCLLILFNLFQMKNNTTFSQIYSAFLLPNNPSILILESDSMTSVRSILKHIIGIGKIPKTLKLVEDFSTDYLENFLTNVEKFPIGKLATVNYPDIPKDEVCQIVDVCKNDKILLKFLPSIDYYILNKNNLDSQIKLNMQMPKDYLAPIFPFEKAKVANWKNGKIQIYGKKIDCICWDDKKFIGEFQYRKFPSSAVKVLQKVNDFEVLLFESGISQIEKQNTFFMGNFLKKQNEFTQKSSVKISSNIGLPSWSRKNRNSEDSFSVFVISSQSDTDQIVSQINTEQICSQVEGDEKDKNYKENKKNIKKSNQKTRKNMKKQKVYQPTPAFIKDVTAQAIGKLKSFSCPEKHNAHLETIMPQNQSQTTPKEKLFDSHLLKSTKVTLSAAEIRKKKKLDKEKQERQQSRITSFLPIVKVGEFMVEKANEPIHITSTQQIKKSKYFGK
ncbi:hypothetical protein TRFO_15379 [Tritrichomonas foetus]|uniref:Uncharacterized protein n=1 Tax=Tritrichomonas foetus TaxID=1144522 RepID=A0A1J4KXN9_9EUKA|nr:hypothetical protein TRFO_15379 [Tritrichomonas foetus]|eukprot:OHT14325.1 hypothetical protein TRFO_15379 [Tritrichomonas foetus]